MNRQFLVVLFLCFTFALFAQTSETDKALVDTLPPPHSTKSVMNFSKVKGWDNGRKPIAPEGFEVNVYADGFDNPRWMYVLPNGDVAVAESNSNYSIWEKIGAWIIGASKSKSMRNSADRITLLRDENKDGIPETRELFLTNLNQPFGMLVLDGWFYVANTDGVWRFSYEDGQTRITEKGKKIADLPAGKHNRHWTRNIIANKDGSKIYIAVGSGSNVAEHGILNEINRACILEINPDGSGLKEYAGGLRNPVGMDWQPETEELWTAVNERDLLGDNLVPDYLTNVEEDGFYGWPYVYLGQNDDPQVELPHPAIVKETLVPELGLGPHTASLGLAFYTQNAFPEKYQNGAFIAQHGSWNRSTLSGYKVVFVPFENGKPAGPPEDFLTGFISNLKNEEVYGRPTGVIVLPDGSLLVTDDASNVIWRVSAKK